MNKTQAGKYLSNLLRLHDPGSLIPIREQLVEILTKAGYKRIVDYKFIKVDRFRVAGRLVKMFGYCVDPPTMRKCFPLSKKKLLERAYPTKIKDPVKYHRQQVLTTARRVINDQIAEFKEKWSTTADGLLRSGEYADYSEFVTCPLSGINLNNGQAVVDHKIPFIKLFEDWLKEEEITPDRIDLLPYGKGFKDRDLQQSWWDYHRKNAVLQMVEKHANIKKSDKGR